MAMIGCLGCDFIFPRVCDVDKNIYWQEIDTQPLTTEY